MMSFVTSTLHVVSDHLWYKYRIKKIFILPIKRLHFIELILKVLFYSGIIFAFTYFFKGHQKYYPVSSSVVIKLNGVGMTNNARRIIWDTVDSVFPFQEENGLFITTNFIATYNQTQGVCPENRSVQNSTCVTDAHCQKDRILYQGNGVITGKCVNATPDYKTCEIKSWCPLQNDMNVDLSTNIIQEIQNYTVLIQNIIVFDYVNIQRSNILENVVGKISSNCIYNGSDELLKYCPIFNVSTFIKYFKEKNLTRLLTYGGILRVTINWKCDLDWSYEHCKPEYSFSELFVNFSNFNNGMSFRYANYYEKDFKEYRTLFKVYGLKILVEVSGYGGKFDFVTFMKLLMSTFNIIILVNIGIRLYLWKNYHDDVYQDVPNLTKQTKNTKKDNDEQNNLFENAMNGITDQNKAENAMNGFNEQNFSEKQQVKNTRESVALIKLDD